MTLPRSACCNQPDGPADDPAVAEIPDITSTCQGYGCRRVTAELRCRGLRANAKKVRRIMAENGLNPRRKRRCAVTADGDYDSPIHPNVALNHEVLGPDQLWVGDITCIAIADGFACLAVSSRRQSWRTGGG